MEDCFLRETEERCSCQRGFILGLIWIVRKQNRPVAGMGRSTESILHKPLVICKMGDKRSFFDEEDER